MADAEGIEVSDDDLLEALEATAEREGTKPDKLLARLKETGRDAPVRRELRLRRAVDAIADSAQPIEPGKAQARERSGRPRSRPRRRDPRSCGLPAPASHPAAVWLTPALRGQDRAAPEAIGVTTRSNSSRGLASRTPPEEIPVARIAARRRDSDVSKTKHPTSRR